jgi:RHS repeat-associated protein
VTYDQFGRVFQRFDGAGALTGLQYHYNSRGYLSHAVESRGSASGNSTEYYRIEAMNARGQVTQMLKGGLRVYHRFDAATGLPEEIEARQLALTLIQDLRFTFDPLGNLEQRRDLSRNPSGSYKNLTESYVYDDLNRLTQKTGAGGTLTMTYWANGNIRSKSNVGASDYVYDAARPHAVTGAGGATYTYNANGSMTGGDGRTIGWTVANQPNHITRGSTVVEIHYGPNRERFRRIDTVSGSVKTTHYVGALERIWLPGGIVETKRYLDGEAIVTRRSNGTTETHYLLKDHLGSIDLITDALGNIVQAMAFDPWGMRRAPTDFTALTVSQLLGFDTSRTTRGYTGHEMFDPVGLIHMNGRVYDPKLGRFISADPHVQAPGNTQNLNRYSYVLNNPLSYTDPSGYFFKKLKKFAGIVIGAVVAVACPACFVGAWGILTGAAIGAASGWIATGSVKGAFMGAVSGAIFGGVGGYFADQGRSVFSASGFLAFGAAGGITEVLSGGNFGHGFVTAGIGALVGASPTLQGAHPGLQVGSKAIVGGTLSAATGGKFANGAASAGFAAIAQQAASELEARLRPGGAGPTGIFKDRRNEYFGSHVEVVHNDHETVISIQLKVARGRGWSDADWAAELQTMRDYWNVEASYEGRIYRVRTELVDLPAAQRHLHDVIVHRDRAVLFQGRADPRSRTIELAHNRHHATGSHEIGHVLGLGHRPDSTRGVMSYYKGNRSFTGEELRSLGVLYDRGGK